MFQVLTRMFLLWKVHHAILRSTQAYQGEGAVSFDTCLVMHCWTNWLLYTTGLLKMQKARVVFGGQPEHAAASLLLHELFVLRGWARAKDDAKCHEAFLASCRDFAQKKAKIQRLAAGFGKMWLWRTRQRLATHALARWTQAVQMHVSNRRARLQKACFRWLEQTRLRLLTTACARWNQVLEQKQAQRLHAHLFAAHLGRIWLERSKRRVGIRTCSRWMHVVQSHQNQRRHLHHFIRGLANAWLRRTRARLLTRACVTWQQVANEARAQRLALLQTWRALVQTKKAQRLAIVLQWQRSMHLSPKVRQRLRTFTDHVRRKLQTKRLAERQESLARTAVMRWKHKLTKTWLAQMQLERGLAHHFMGIVGEALQVLLNNYIENKHCDQCSRKVKSTVRIFNSQCKLCLADKHTLQMASVNLATTANGVSHGKDLVQVLQACAKLPERIGPIVRVLNEPLFCRFQSLQGVLERFVECAQRFVRCSRRVCSWLAFEQWSPFVAYVLTAERFYVQNHWCKQWRKRYGVPGFFGTLRRLEVENGTQRWMRMCWNSEVRQPKTLLATLDSQAARKVEAHAERKLENACKPKAKTKSGNKKLKKSLQ